MRAHRLCLVVSVACASGCTIDDRTIDVRRVSYTFDTDAQGWQLSGPPPDGGIATALVFESTDGDPGSGSGSLQLTVTYTDFLQTADAIVDLTARSLDLSGRRLHASVRWVSGPIPPNGGLALHASTGPSYVFAAQYVDFTFLPVGQWVPLTFDLGKVTTAGFDASSVVQIGVYFFSAGPERGPLTPGDTVFEIDSVVDEATR